jgi:cytochrome c-type biogenesis protein CcmH
MFTQFTKRFSQLILALLFAGLAMVVFASTIQAAPPAQSAGPEATSARGATPNDVNRVARQLYCPVCPNTPLNVCETQACKDWRELIRQKLSAGSSDQEIIDYFVVQYGQRVLAAPPPRGFNLLVWIIPLLALGAGVAALVVVLRSWSAQRGRAATPAPSVPSAEGSDRTRERGNDELPADYVARVERELLAMRSH